ncbi:hypothetical protein HJ590_10140 [Naumannella sp. ID2617S]|uniref:Uncharacterized protein n=1 Tax=Enemella dayhoffiae TaxID=2016507 RepID=A0A255H0G7_9ACTN|nr:hypothetical protein [Enemella dayhoffiae]NNG19927.1 hypothetical protein [Naumannella sp. ID2617S]OYO21245.1 hypothetical protein CGZ93_10695 [Enemella dayhoffiae]
MSTQLIGLAVLALTVGLIVLALQLNHRRARTVGESSDPDTRRLLVDLRHARDRQWRSEAAAPERRRDELVQFQLQSLRQ